MAGEKERVDAYLHTVARMEPEITPVDQLPALASIAISLKRIADALDDLREIAVAQDARDETHRL